MRFETFMLLFISLLCSGIALLIYADTQNFKEYERQCLASGGTRAIDTAKDGDQCWSADGRRLFIKESE